MSKVEEYKRTHAPRGTGSKLDRFSDDIKALMRDGYSLSQIADYLANYESTKVSVSAISNWVRRSEKTKATEPTKQG